MTVAFHARLARISQRLSLEAGVERVAVHGRAAGAYVSPFERHQMSCSEAAARERQHGVASFLSMAAIFSLGNCRSQAVADQSRVAALKRPSKRLVRSHARGSFV